MGRQIVELGRFITSYLVANSCTQVINVSVWAFLAITGLLVVLVLLWTDQLDTILRGHIVMEARVALGAERIVCFASWNQCADSLRVVKGIPGRALAFFCGRVIKLALNLAIRLALFRLLVHDELGVTNTQAKGIVESHVFTRALQDVTSVVDIIECFMDGACVEAAPARIVPVLVFLTVVVLWWIEALLHCLIVQSGGFAFFLALLARCVEKFVNLASIVAVHYCVVVLITLEAARLALLIALIEGRVSRTSFAAKYFSIVDWLIGRAH